MYREQDSYWMFEDTAFWLLFLSWIVMFLLWMRAEREASYWFKLFIDLLKRR